MVIGEKLKTLRAQKNLSQGDIEKRTGLLRCYISRIENGHTVPSVDTLEKLARALEVPMYRLFIDDEHVKKPNHYCPEKPARWAYKYCRVSAIDAFWIKNDLKCKGVE
jgi:transcriptional regulator with XRE-family HTH domain